MEKRVIAGFVLFFGFIINTVTIILVILDIVDIGTAENSAEQARLNEYYLSLTLNIIFASLILVGAMSALSGWKWGIALGGAVLCLLSVGIMFLASLCGLVAVILLWFGKNEFKVQVVYVDERGHDYGGQQVYEDAETGDQYYEGAGGYSVYDNYQAQTTTQETPAIELVDQYGKAEAHQYNEEEHRYK